MRELHVVALSEDGRHVVLATSPDAGRGGFRVALDERLLAAVRGDLPRPGEESARGSALSPREIQARLRAGETEEEIARAAGVPVARIERFSGPVVSERSRVIEATREGYVLRARRGRSRVPLGEAVDRQLAQTPSLRPESVAWTARRDLDGTWLVELSYVARARLRTARWRYVAGAAEVSALDPASAALAFAEPDEAPHRELAAAVARPRRRAAAARSRRTPSRAAATPAARTPAKAQRAKPAASPAARGAKPGPTKAATPKARAAKAGTSKARTPPKAAAAKAAAAPRRAPKAEPTARAPKPAPAKAAPAKAAPQRRRALQVVPDPSPATAERAARGRASVPAWADVLLSTAPRPDPAADS